jgi:hypothetical protein
MKNQKFPAWWSQPNKCRSTGSLFELFKPYTQRYRNSTSMRNLENPIIGRGEKTMYSAS